MTNIDEWYLAHPRHRQMHYRLLLSDSNLLVFSLNCTYYVIISCSITYWCWQVQSLCFSVIITHQSEPHTPGYVMAFQSVTKVISMVMVISGPTSKQRLLTRCQELFSVLLRRATQGSHPADGFSLTGSSCIEVINNQPESVDLVVWWSSGCPGYSSLLFQLYLHG